ncbi:MAG: hypothetical protein A2V66_05430 [Ignavibacteria bacterium RBG_13_36_8]|nr:MAG: hypothetical protein A2V66_05430 [Ignavibacteria bacterium RBG_13_36_8]
MSFLLSDIIGIAAIFQACFLVIFFLTYRKGDKTTNVLFAALLFAFMINIGFSLAQSEVLYVYFKDFLKVIFLINQVAFLIGPLFYLYIKSIIIRDFYLTKRDALHTLPFIFSLIYFLAKLYLPLNIDPTHISIKYFYSGGLLVQELFYLMLIFILLKKNNLSLKSLFSRTKDTKLSWLRLFLVGYILLWNMKLQTFVFTNIRFYPDFCPYRESLYFLVMFLFLNTIMFFALRKSELFSSFEKYNGSKLDEANKEKYKSQLINFLRNEKLYLDPELTLPGLSEKLSIPVRCLSQVINDSFKKNFNDFINSYRVEESVRMLTDQSNGKKSILEIAYHVGFNSKSSFYDAFKKHTGVTPKKYKSTALK